jgi:hypothetical protein
VEKYGTAGQATDESIIGECALRVGLKKATNSHSEYVLLIAFPRAKIIKRIYVEYKMCVFFFLIFSKTSV